jgi:phosphoenolpyruvate carboxylase
VYLAEERKNKDEIQGSFTPFRMTTSEEKMIDFEGRKTTTSKERKTTTSKERRDDEFEGEEDA